MLNKIVYSCFIVFLLFLGCQKKNAVSNNGGQKSFQFENAIQLTTDVEDINPRWSPTGEHIVFERRNNIYILDASLGSILLITEGRSPTWSPTGSYIAFIKDGELYSVNAQSGGPELRKLTIGSNVSYASGIDWGGSNRIAYFQQGDSVNSDYMLTIYWPAYEYFQLVNSIKLGFSEMPRWSCDGDSILFSSRRQGICIYNVNQELLHSVLYWGNVGKTCWYTTTDSTFILFIEDGILYMINPDGSDREIISGENFHPGSMDYCHNTRRLAFSNLGIWIMDFPPPEEEIDFQTPSTRKLRFNKKD